MCGSARLAASEQVLTIVPLPWRLIAARASRVALKWRAQAECAHMIPMRLAYVADQIVRIAAIPWQESIVVQHVYDAPPGTVPIFSSKRIKSNPFGRRRKTSRRPS